MKKLNLNLLILCHCVWVLSGCFYISEILDKYKTQPVPLTAIVTSTSRPMIVSRLSSNLATYSQAPSTPAAGGMVLSGAGQAPAGGAINAATDVTGGIVGTGTTGSASTSINYDATAAFSILINVSKSPATTTDVVCQLSSPYSNKPCSLSDLTMDSTEVTAGNLTISSGSVQSNSLASIAISVKTVVASTTVSNVNGIISCGGKIFIAGNNVAAGVTKGFIYNPTLHTLQYRVNTGNTWNDNISDLLCYNNRYVLFKSSNTNYRSKRFIYDMQLDSLSQYTNLINDQNSNELGGYFLDGDKFYSFEYRSGGITKLIEIDLVGSSASQVSNLTGNNGTNDTLANGSTVMKKWNGRLFFQNYTGITSGDFYELEYVSGTPVINQRINTNAGTDSVNLSLSYAYQDSLYFSALTANGFNKLFRFNLTGNTIQQVSNTVQNSSAHDGSALIGPRPQIGFNGKVLFTSSNTSGANKIFSYDINNHSVEQITNTTGNQAVSDNAQSFVELGNYIYFVSANTNTRMKLYRLNKTTEVIERLSNTAGDENISDNVSNVKLYADKIYFTANNSQNQSKLYFFEPTSSTIHQIFNSTGDQNTSDNYQQVTLVGNELYFQAAVGAGTKLFRLCDPAAGCTQ